ncbi:hypothetical protein pb186bvf_007723 [Paramecium bursaria]
MMQEKFMDHFFNSYSQQSFKLWVFKYLNAFFKNYVIISFKLYECISDKFRDQEENIKLLIC